MIPKKIHYCWFGGAEKPELVKRCLESWKKYCPTYEIIEWNEDNFDVNSNLYVSQAYNAKKWAFVSDYVRLNVLYTYGGIYLDTDVELFKPLDVFTDNDAFVGFESKDSTATAVIGSKANNNVIEYLLSYYDDAEFLLEDGSNNLTTNTVVVSKQLQSIGIKLNGKFQKVENITIYPQIVFCPSNFSLVFGKYSRKTYGQHYGVKSWGNDMITEKRGFSKRLRSYMVNKARNIFGTKSIQKLADKIK